MGQQEKSVRSLYLLLYREAPWIWSFYICQNYDDFGLCRQDDICNDRFDKNVKYDKNGEKTPWISLFYICQNYDIIDLRYQDDICIDRYDKNVAIDWIDRNVVNIPFLYTVGIFFFWVRGIINLLFEGNNTVLKNLKLETWTFETWLFFISLQFYIFSVQLRDGFFYFHACTIINRLIIFLKSMHIF